MDNRTGGAGTLGRAMRHDERGRPAVIGVDCDGVLASDRQLWRRMRERYPEHIPARYDDLTTFEWPRATAETTELCLQLSADPDFAERLDPIAGAVAALHMLRGAGYRIHVITARPRCVRDATWRWMWRRGVGDCIEDVHCVDGGPQKAPLALELGCRAFVEDNHATAEALGAAGIRSYLLDAPYNRLPNVASKRMAGWSAVVVDLLYSQEPWRVVTGPARMSAAAARERVAVYEAESLAS